MKRIETKGVAIEMLTQALIDLTSNGYVTDNTWAEKVKTRMLALSKRSFIMTLVLQRIRTGEGK
ncbi:hypothetical protein GOP56_03330 [Brevibacillus sp. 7WMA2]|uniref:hypothetical protein n=1 Tax=Brevibacillus sp. 7WMA2 TaxID=2683193 RepID=UPI0013A7A785|nr:hypothetical protein [Brevibacillus sp. 7WMA2]QIC04722.1 hypothetical protein GOP56_03330 [Brevibacillus sp. 7WMA2]WPS89866.1 hypothetical protein SMD22_13315 [Brevibacillus halotolerans]